MGSSSLGSQLYECNSFYAIDGLSLESIKWPSLHQAFQHARISKKMKADLPLSIYKKVPS